MSERPTTGRTPSDVLHEVLQDQEVDEELEKRVSEIEDQLEAIWTVIENMELEPEDVEEKKQSSRERIYAGLLQIL